MRMRIIRFIIFAGLFWGSLAILPFFSKSSVKKPAPPSASSLTRQEQKIADCVTLESGFGNVEKWGVWSIAKTSVISLVLPAEPKDLSLVFKAQAFGKIKYVDVFYGTQKIAHWPIVKYSADDYVLDCSALPRGKRIRLTFESNELSRPCDLIEGSADKRTLGFGLCSVRIGGK